jgi:hypothetical protein
MKGRRALALAVLVCAGVGCGHKPGDLESQTIRDRSFPNVADVVCRRDGSTKLLTPVVAVSRDGVHVRVHNHTGEWVSLNGLAVDAPEGVSREVSQIPPGNVEEACWPYSRHEGKHPKAVPLRIVDPRGVWIDPELECEGDLVQSSIWDYAVGAPGRDGSPVAITKRTFRGLDAEDVVRRAGYPEARSPTVAVVRDGRTVASASFHRADEGGWLVGGTSRCSEEGIREEI